jgi:hypothetical protein
MSGLLKQVPGLFAKSGNRGRSRGAVDGAWKNFPRNRIPVKADKGEVMNLR